MRGENKTARELWLLDAAVARSYLIKVTEGLVKAVSCLLVSRENNDIRLVGSLFSVTLTRY